MQTIYIDISNKMILPTIYAKQNDIGRKFEVVFTDAGVTYNIPAGALFSVWYNGDSGDGNYTNIGDSSAFSITGSRVVVEMITQMLANSGNGTLCLVMNHNGKQIGSWNIPYICESVPGTESEEARSYYTAFSEAVSKINDPDETLTLKRFPADAKATGDALKLKANSGYGYDGEAVNLGLATNENQLNTAIDAVYIGMNQRETKMIRWSGYPSQENDWFGILSKSSDDSCTLTAQSSYNNGALILKTKTDGTWQPIEWEAPPMLLFGTEYRTTERWQGMPVYTKLIDCLTIPASGRTVITHKIGYRIIKLSGSTSNGTNLPYRDAGVNGYIDLGTSKNSLVITSSIADGNSPGTGVVQLWYVKE